MFSEEQAKAMLHHIAITLANVQESKSEHHDKIIVLFQSLANKMQNEM